MLPLYSLLSLYIFVQNNYPVRVLMMQYELNIYTYVIFRL